MSGDDADPIDLVTPYHWRPSAIRSDVPTDHQLRVFTWLFDHVCRMGYQPSLADLAAEFGGSPQALAKPLLALAEKGYLASGDTGQGVQSRARQLLKNPDGTPFRGLVPKGPEGRDAGRDDG